MCKAGRFSERVVIATVVLHTPKFGTLGDQEFSVKLEMKKKKKKKEKPRFFRSFTAVCYETTG